MKTLKHIQVVLIVVLISCFSLSTASAQSKMPTISKEEQKQVVDSVIKFMKENYVFPEVGNKVADIVATNFKKGKYSSLTDPMAFSDKLTTDLRSVNNDKHISVRFNSKRMAMQMGGGEKDPEDTEAMRDKMNAQKNFGFEEVKILDGNIGYLKLNQFIDAESGGETAIAAMNFLANTNALIIDLRDNGGGSPSMIQLLSSYLFEETRVHLNTFYYRESDEYTQFYTLPFVPGKKMPSTAIYILTSNYTFSAAEEFTYNLKNLERATIVGETTGGGAHPVNMMAINKNFGMSVPIGKAINPITKTNWEGTGIEPHIKTTKEDALEKAMVSAMEKLLEKETDPFITASLKWSLDGIKANDNPVVIDKEILKSYVGNYGERKITFKDGDLYYQRGGQSAMKMIPLKPDYFMFDEVSYFRLKIKFEDNKVVGIEGNYDNGRVDFSEKTE